MSSYDNIGQKEKKKKRKRTQNTSKEQYKLYLSFLKNDYAFRSGIVDLTLGENYISQKWEELSNKLNATGAGSLLIPDEWKKRFTDWKYATRAKHGKKCEYRSQTGSGPQSNMFE